MATDYSLDYSDEKNWVKRSPEERSRLLELRAKQGTPGGGAEDIEKWERALQYAGSAYAEAVKRSSHSIDDTEDMYQALLLNMFEVDARRTTMRTKASELATERSIEENRSIYYQDESDLSKVLVTGDLEQDSRDGKRGSGVVWTTWLLKACLLTGKMLPPARIHNTASLDHILQVAKGDHPPLDGRVMEAVLAVKNEPYRNALVAITEGSLADHDNRAAAVRQGRALEVAAKILNGIWSGI